MSQCLEVKQYWGDLCLDVLHFSGQDVTIGPNRSDDFCAADAATLFRFNRNSGTYSPVQRGDWNVITGDGWEIDTCTYRFSARLVSMGSWAPKERSHPDVLFLIAGLGLAATLVLLALVGGHELSKALAPPQCEIARGCYPYLSWMRSGA